MYDVQTEVFCESPPYEWTYNGGLNSDLCDVYVDLDIEGLQMVFLTIHFN